MIICQTQVIFILGNITSIFTSLDSQRVRHEQQVTSLSEHALYKFCLVSIIRVTVCLSVVVSLPGQLSYFLTVYLFSPYFTSLYWSVTVLTSVGYGYIQPHSVSEKCSFHLVHVVFIHYVTSAEPLYYVVL